MREPSETMPTARQRQVLILVQEFVAKNNYPPTKRELANLLGVKSATGVNDILEAAEKKGLVKLIPFISRGIIMTEAGLEALKNG